MRDVIYRFNDDSGCWHVYLVYNANPLDGIERQEIEVSQICTENEAESIVEAIKEFARL